MYIINFIKNINFLIQTSFITPFFHYLSIMKHLEQIIFLISHFYLNK